MTEQTDRIREILTRFFWRGAIATEQLNPLVEELAALMKPEPPEDLKVGIHDIFIEYDVLGKSREWLESSLIKDIATLMTPKTDGEGLALLTREERMKVIHENETATTIDEFVIALGFAQARKQLAADQAADYIHLDGAVETLTASKVSDAVKAFGDGLVWWAHDYLEIECDPNSHERCETYHIPRQALEARIKDGE